MTIDPKNGFLILTGVNSEDGTVDSESYIVDGAGSEHDSQGRMIETFHVRDGDADPEPWIIQIRRPDAVLPEVEPYRQLLRIMIDNDARFPGPVASLADYLDGASPELLALIERER